MKQQQYMNRNMQPLMNHPQSREHYLETARSIGARLVSKAIWDGDRCNWQGSAVEPVDGNFKVVIRTFGTDIYNGTPGVAYFLSQLYSLAPEDTLALTIEGAVNQFLSIYDGETANGSNTLNFSFYSGKVGIAYVLVTAGLALQKEEWIKKALDILKKMEKENPGDMEIDVVSGVAGAIPALLKLYAILPEKFIKDLAIKCGDFLLEKAEPSAQGLSWNVMPGKFNLTGFSHGAAGAAAALMELAALTDKTEYMEAAAKGFEYERHFFNPQEQNWYDLRDDIFNPQSNTYVCGMAWCHGAPGIALSRLKAYRLTRDATYLQEANIALQTTQRSLAQSLQAGMQSMHTGAGTGATAGENFSLCHGLAGNADVLIAGAVALNRPDMLQVAQSLGNYGIEKYSKYNMPWPSGVNDLEGKEPNLETPGLLLGLAGTGYFYLRLYDPQKFENVLCL